MASEATSIPDYDVLFIACSFPPVAGTASRGNAETVRQLYQAGFKVAVVAADFTVYPRDESLPNLPAGINVHRFTARDDDTISRKIIRNLGFPPDRVSFRWTRDIEKVAGLLIQRYRIPLVYSVFGNGGEHLATLRLKKRFAFHWIAEFRDPWIGNWIYDEYMRAAALRPWARWLRYRLQYWLKRIHQSADLLLAESPGHRERLVREFGNPEKIWTNYLGTDAEIREIAEDPPLRLPRRPVIGFVGKTYYGYDDLGVKFIRALKTLEREGEEFTFVCAGENFFPGIAVRENLESCIPFGRLPYRKAIGLLAAADMAMVMIPGAYPENINSKIYEAIQLGTPILGLVPAQGSMAELIGRHELGTVLPLQEPQLTDALRLVLAGIRHGQYSITGNARHALAKATLMQPIVERMRQLMQES